MNRRDLLDVILIVALVLALFVALVAVIAFYHPSETVAYTPVTVKITPTTRGKAEIDKSIDRTYSDAEIGDFPKVVSHEWQTFVCTAYCPNECCCGKWSSIAYKATASGTGAVEGVTIAADESVPFGTTIYLEGVGERVVQDRGGEITGNRIDVYFETHEDACAFGMRTVRGYVKESKQ